MLDPGYLDGIADAPDPVVRAKHDECTEVETEVSYVRRLAQARIEKLSARDGFRHVATVGVRYETPPDALLAIVADVERRLRAEPLVDPKSAMAHFTGFGDSALNIEMRATFQTLDMPTYRAAVQRLNVDVMRIVAAHGSGFAFPSRTVYMAQDTGIGAAAVTGASPSRPPQP